MSHLTKPRFKSLRTLGDPLPLRLRVVALYFRGAAWFAGVATIVQAAWFAAAPSSLRMTMRPLPWILTIGAITTWSLFTTATQLRARRRQGVVMAAVAFAGPLMSALRGHVAHTPTIALCALGCLAVMSVWRELE